MSPTVRVGETPTLVSSLVDQLRQRLAADDAPARLVVGLVGAPGSGKSTIAAQLETELKAAGIFAGLVAMDGFHLSVAAGSIVSGTGVVVTEGNYLALETRGWGAARERIDLLIHIDVPEEVLVLRLINRHEDFGKNPLAAGHWVRTVDLPNARLIATSVHRCDEVWREPEDEPDSDDVDTDDELE